MARIADIKTIKLPVIHDSRGNLSYVENTLHSVQNSLKEGQLLVLESTTYPGTTEEILVPFIEKIPANVKSKENSIHYDVLARK